MVRQNHNYLFDNVGLLLMITSQMSKKAMNTSNGKILFQRRILLPLLIISADSAMNCVVLLLDRKDAFTEESNFSAAGVACVSLQNTRVICDRKKGNLCHSLLYPPVSPNKMKMSILTGVLYAFNTVTINNRKRVLTPREWFFLSHAVLLSLRIDFKVSVEMIGPPNFLSILVIER